MKRIHQFIFILFVLCNWSYAQNEECNSFQVWIDIDDNPGEFTNIRATPNGIINFKINHGNYNSWGYFINVIGSDNTWLKINHIAGTEECVISNFEGWIHSSVVAISTTHDIYLLDQPNGEKVIKVTGETLEHYKVFAEGEDLVEIQGDPVNHFKIIDIDCNWLKLKSEKGSGWVKSEKLCGNPVTTCP